MIETASTYYFPNKLGRMMLLAFEEVIGKSGINAVLNLSSLPHLIDNYPPDDDHKIISFETIGRLQYMLEQAYGPHGGRGLALRTGRVFFSSCMRIYGPELGFSDPTFRLQPPDLKIVAALNSLMNFFNIIFYGALNAVRGVGGVMKVNRPVILQSEYCRKHCIGLAGESFIM